MPDRAVRVSATALWLAACAGAHVEPAPAAPGEPEPEPELHAHPEIPPDELTALDAGARGAIDSPDATAVPPCDPLPRPPAAPARIRAGPPLTNRIPAEIVMRPVRARVGCFRSCYQAALARDAGLAGVVAVRFVIDVDGWARSARVESDATGDATFASCVAAAFVGVAFPAPESGRVTVIYPLTFGPDAR